MGAFWGSWGKEKAGRESCGSNAFSAVPPNDDIMIFNNTYFIVCM